MKYIAIAVVSGFVIALSSYIASNSHPVIAGFLASVPIILPAMVFMESDEYSEYSKSLMFGVIAYLLSVVALYYFINYLKFSKNMSIFMSMTLWFVIISIIYFTMYYLS